jgi:hypothetical protein
MQWCVCVLARVQILQQFKVHLRLLHAVFSSRSFFQARPSTKVTRVCHLAHSSSLHSPHLSHRTSQYCLIHYISFITSQIFLVLVLTWSFFAVTHVPRHHTQRYPLRRDWGRHKFDGQQGNCLRPGRQQWSWSPKQLSANAVELGIWYGVRRTERH